tara:strand:- start:74 stop:598 length:525 start_codon:yes stop_codon:yes gene_type:complete
MIKEEIAWNDGLSEWVSTSSINEITKFVNINSSFGYRSSFGGGRVVYIYSDQINDHLIKVLLESRYEDKVELDGDLIHNYSEYDPSYLKSSVYNTDIEDECWSGEFIDDFEDTNHIQKFKEFLLKDVLEKEIPIIFINTHLNYLYQIKSEDIDFMMNMLENDFNIYVREYDIAE